MKIDCTVICQIDIVIPVLDNICLLLDNGYFLSSPAAPDGISSSTTSASINSASLSVRTDFPVGFLVAAAASLMMEANRSASLSAALCKSMSGIYFWNVSHSP